MTLAGLTFDVTGATAPPMWRTRPGSERERVFAMVAKAGYQMPAEQLNLRLIHLPDEAKRKEMMLVYAEDLSMSGTSVNALNSRAGRRSGKQ